MWKYKTQSLIGIFGLAFGFACFIPALYWLRHETSYDRFYHEAEQIYRFYSVEKQSGKVNEFVSGILDRKLQEQFPAMETSTVFFILNDRCSTEGMPNFGLNTLFSDSTFLSVFPQMFVSGNARQPLDVLNNIILTETTAIRLFGDVEKAIGQQIKTIMYPWNQPYMVTAVVKDPPPNTNLSFEAILYHEQFKLQRSFEERNDKQIWTLATLQGYVRFHPNTDIDRVAEQLRDFSLRIDTDANMEVRILPVSDVRHHLNADVPFALNFIRLFVAAGILLLFSALFNFMNLHLDIFHQRIHELRRRAVLGAKSRQLITQMLFELAYSIFLALGIAYIFVVFTCPVFSDLLGVTPEMSQLTLLFVVCGTGLMALMLFIGFIPFWHLSIIALRQLPKRKVTGQTVLRRIAITLQLAVSVIFIIAASVVMMQMRFVSHKDLGFDRHGIVHLSGLNINMNNSTQAAYVSGLASIPQIEGITVAYFEPHHSVDFSSLVTEVEWQGKISSEKPVFQSIATDSRFAEIFGLKMFKGEWFDDIGEDKIIINEEAARVMGLSEPIGSIIRIYDGNTNSMKEYRIVGVVNDFHTMSLRSRIYPTIIGRSQIGSGLYIRVVSGQEQEAIRRITELLSGIDASMADVIRLTTLDELYDSFNQSEQAGLKMFSVLATICLLISLFGIYAVASAATYRRRKEVAIRKIVGAKVIDIILIFFREYAMLAIIAGIVALPLAYIAMNRWLQGYAYRINIPLWLFVIVIFGVVAVVILTVLGQVLKAANSNPGKVVKNE